MTIPGFSLSFITVARSLGTYSYTIKDLSELDVDRVIDEKIMDSILDVVWGAPGSEGKSSVWKTKSFVTEVCRQAADAFEISGFEGWMARTPLFIDGQSGRNRSLSTSVTLEFANRVNQLLPEQPWKPGVQKGVIQKLDCTVDEYFAATQLLIEEGLRNHQRDGVVFDQDGNVVCFDPDRVDPETMSLIQPEF